MMNFLSLYTLYSTGGVYNVQCYINFEIARKSMSRLSVGFSKGTASILYADAMIFSPTIGVFALSAPHFVANMRRFDSNSCSSKLAQELFNQRQDASGRRFGAVAATKTKSRAAYWLSPSAIGQLVGLAVSDKAMNVSIVVHLVVVF
jgi:hypothetical protein